MNFRLSLFGGALAVACLIGCDGPSTDTTPAAANQPKDTKAAPTLDVSSLNLNQLFPLKKGSQWVYDESIGGSDDERAKRNVVQLAVVETTASKTEVTALMSVTRNGQDAKADYQTWMVTPNGLYQTAAGKDQQKFSSPQPIAKYPLHENDRYTWVGEGLTPAGKWGRMEVHSVVLPSIMVDTDQGQISAIPVESDTKFAAKLGKSNEFTHGVSTSTIFLTPEMGMVRFREEISINNGSQVELLKLKSHTVKS